jgi:hypothetical protein
VALDLVFVLHVADEAATGFLSVYNPTVTAVRERFRWFPMPTSEYGEWLAGLSPRPVHRGYQQHDHRGHRSHARQTSLGSVAKRAE